MRGSDSHRDEAGRLRVIAAELARVVESPDYPEPPEPDESLLADNRLQDYVSELRSWYLCRLAAITAPYWRTPPTGEASRFPGTMTSYDYAYDRQHPPRVLETRLHRDVPGTGALLCSSGMAALNVTFQAISYLLPRVARLVAMASYFETFTLLRVGSFAGRWSRVTAEDELVEAIIDGDVQVVLIEPVQYGWSLATADWSALIGALAQLDDPPLVLVDTTLSGDCEIQDALLDRLNAVVPVLVRIRSGIKLDQEGLELANLGIVEWWHDPDCSRFEQLGSVLAACRTVTGATLSWPDACALAPRFVLSPGGLRSYSAGVFTTNRLLYETVRRGPGLFSEVVYPQPPWSSPFVLFKLGDGSAENYQLLAALLRREQERRGLMWRMSGSFGFRSARYETILPAEQLRPNEAPAGVLKVAAGRYPGARFKEIVNLLDELSLFDTVADARHAWSRRYIAVEGQR